MDGSGKGTGGGAADNPTPDQNPSPNSPPPAAAGDDDAAHAAAAEGRRPFTSLSQEEADLALARVLQEQERAYMMLTGQGGGEYAMLDAEGYDYDDEDGEEEDVRDYDAMLLGRTTMEQDEEEEDEDDEEGDGDPQDAWEDVDPDEYSYEELVALGEVVGTESKGLSAETIASLPSVTYQAQDKQDGNMEQCVICRVEFDEGESLVALPCKHSYHSECINHWLQLNKVCPMCSAEVATSVTKQDMKPDFNNGKK